jgi:hypothetical protein
METERQKNAVFGIVVSNAGRKGAVSGSSPLPSPTPSTGFFRDFMHYCIALLVQYDPRSKVIFSTPASLAIAAVMRLSVARVSSPHLT